MWSHWVCPGCTPLDPFNNYKNKSPMNILYDERVDGVLPRVDKSALISQLRDALPDLEILHSQEDLRPYECDGLSAYRVMPLLVVLPPVSRHQLALYCGGSGDHNPIHVDLDFAKKFGFKDVFAHGMLSMAFLGRLVTSYAPSNRVRKLGTRFTSITWVGDVITVSGKVTGKREENGEKLIDLEVKCTNQNGQDTLQGHATVAAA